MRASRVVSLSKSSSHLSTNYLIHAIQKNRIHTNNYRVNKIQTIELLKTNEEYDVVS